MGTYQHNKKVFIGSLLDWLIGDNLLLRDFEPCGKIFMNVCGYIPCHGNAVKGLCALWDNTYDSLLLSIPNFLRAVY
jgi:hypothetical protein